MPEHRILFICHGNICRSPMAEIILRDKVERQGLAAVFLIDSRATSTEEICGGVGNPVYPPARAELARHGLRCGQHRAHLLTPEDYGRYDLLIGMDTRNIQNILRITGGDPAHKVRRLLDYTSGGDIADPWYTGRFDVTYRDIESGCTALLKELLEEDEPDDSAHL